MKTINKILITGRLYSEINQALEGRTSKEIISLPEEMVTEEVLRTVDAYVAFRPTENFDFYNIKWVHALGAGVDSFLFEREWKRDVLLTRTICSFGRKISEYCLSYILAQLQQHKKLEEQQRDKLWEPVMPNSLCEQNITILGTGVIGQELAKTLGFFGAQVIGVSLSGLQKECFKRVIKLENIKEILPETNWLINTLPLTSKTEGVINEDIFNYMKNSSFINVGRGATLDEYAMMKALDKGNIKQAVLDVFPMEPLNLQSQLWSNPNVKITPHISAITSVVEAVECFLSTLRDFENGNSILLNKVDIEKGY